MFLHLENDKIPVLPDQVSGYIKEKEVFVLIGYDEEGRIENEGDIQIYAGEYKHIKRHIIESMTGYPKVGVYKLSQRKATLTYKYYEETADA